MRTSTRLAVLLSLCVASSASIASEDYTARIESALRRAGDNAAEIRQTLQSTPADQQAGIQFLVANMPQRDLQSLSAEFLLENTALAYEAWRNAPWNAQVSESLFLNNVLPYASVTERRDNWRRDFCDRFQDAVSEAKTPGEAAAMLNSKIFFELNVRYSTTRRRPDQGPYESIESGVATCTGLSILLIDACRAVGVPARFVGTPRWADDSGNHSWVEVWDDGWHYTGAAEPNGMKLDAGWFTARASLAKRDESRYAIYATSFKQTPIHFPCVWSRRADYVAAVNVTDRYTADQQELPEGMARAMFRVVTGPSGDRCRCQLRVESPTGDLQFEGLTKDERFDMNDHTTVVVPLNQPLVVKIDSDEGSAETTVELEESDQLFTIDLSASAQEATSPSEQAAATRSASGSASETSHD